MSTSPWAKSLSIFWPLCFDFNKIIVWRIWLLLLWCFVSFFITAPKLGDFQIISQSSPPNSIQNKGCLQSGWSSGCHHHWGQNWLENRIADISRISVMYLVFQSIKVLGWSTGIVLWALLAVQFYTFWVTSTFLCLVCRDLSTYWPQIWYISASVPLLAPQ